MSLLHGCRHNYVLSYSNVASWKGQESQCDILMSAGGWNVISIKQVVQKDYNHNLQSKSNSLDYSTVFYFDVDLPANKISNSFKDYLSTLKIPVMNVCHVLEIKNIYHHLCQKFVAQFLGKIFAVLHLDIFVLKYFLSW